MKKTIQKMGVISAALLTLAIGANAQWTENATSVFLTNGTKKVGIGTNAPSFPLDIKQDGNCNFRVQSLTSGSSNLILARSTAATANCFVNYKTGTTALWYTGVSGGNTDFRIRNAAGTDNLFIAQATGNVGVGTTTSPYKLTIASGANTAIGLDNGASIFAKNSAGTYEAFIWPRWTDNKTYMNYGAGGFDIRNSSSTKTMVMTSDNHVAINNAANTTSTLTINDPVTYNSNLTTGALLQLGNDAGVNLSFDINQVQARNNGSASTLYLNPHDGGTQVGPYIFVTPTELEVTHTAGSGFDHGLRIRNIGAANHYWTFYSTNNTDNLEVNYLGTAKGNFNGVSGAYAAVSDRKFKKNLENVTDVLSNINKLDVLKYNFNEQKEGDRKFYGMIAQDVEKVFPEVVFNNKTDDGKDYYTMDYSAFGVIAVKGLQEMNKENADLKTEVSDLKKQLFDMNDCLQSLCNNASASSAERIKSITPQDANSLFQNSPNPFNQTTVIRYQLLSGDANAIIIIRDLSGNLAKQISIAQAGKGQVTINANELAQGTYTYTLEIGGSSIDTKLMVVTK